MGPRFLLIFPLLLLAACVSLGEQAPAPFTNYGQGIGVGSAGVHNVSAGDTLYIVSQSYHLPMRDIVTLNNLQAPFKLYDGQRLLLPPPQEYTARNGDTIYSVSRIFGVNSSEIARLNNLKAPYTLSEGKKLRLPFVTRKTQLSGKAPERLVKVAQANQNILKAPTAINKPAGVQTNTRYVFNGQASAQKPMGEVLSSPSQSPQQLQMPKVPQLPQQQQRPAWLDEEPLDAPSAPEEEKPAQVQTASLESGSMIKPSQKPPYRQSGKTVMPRTPHRSSSKFMRPVKGEILSDFGPKPTGLHNDGINIQAKKGTPVLAAENGVVVYAGNELKGSGNLVLIRHEDQWVTAYAHMSQFNIHKGDIVKRGEKIGEVGATGYVSEPQLHFEIRRGTDAINPKNYMEK